MEFYLLRTLPKLRSAKVDYNTSLAVCQSFVNKVKIEDDGVFPKSRGEGETGQTGMLFTIRIDANTLMNGGCEYKNQDNFFMASMVDAKSMVTVKPAIEKSGFIGNMITNMVIAGRYCVASNFSDELQVARIDSWNNPKFYSLNSNGYNLYNTVRNCTFAIDRFLRSYKTTAISVMKSQNKQQNFQYDIGQWHTADLDGQPDMSEAVPKWHPKIIYSSIGCCSDIFVYKSTLIILETTAVKLFNLESKRIMREANFLEANIGCGGGNSLSIYLSNDNKVNMICAKSLKLQDSINLEAKVSDQRRRSIKCGMMGKAAFVAVISEQPIIIALLASYNKKLYLASTFDVSDSSKKSSRAFYLHYESNAGQFIVSSEYGMSRLISIKY